MRSDVRLDDRVFQRQLAEYVDRSGIDQSEVIRSQSVLFLQLVIRLTPPKRKRQGERAVELGLNMAVTRLSPKDFTNPSIRAAIQNHRHEALTRIAENSKGEWGKGWRAVPFEEKLHSDARGTDGRVRRKRKVMTPDQHKWGKYLKRKKKNVGTLKAGWLAAFQLIDPSLPRVPGWVSSQRRFGSGQDQSRRPDQPFVEIENRAMGVRRQQSLVNFALRVRARSMRSDLRRKLIESGRRVGWQPGL